MENVGLTILNQMKAINTQYLWSWGSHAYRIFTEGQFTSQLKPHLGGLVFRVQGRKYHGNVIITLEASDTYHIYYGQLRKGEIKIQAEQSDVYVEDLMDILDSFIET